MLFTCPGAAARGGTGRRAGRGRVHVGVDIHCHVQCPAADEMVKDVPRPGPDPTQQFSNDLTRATNRKQMDNVWSCLTSVPDPRPQRRSAPEDHRAPRLHGYRRQSEPPQGEEVPPLTLTRSPGVVRRSRST